MLSISLLSFSIFSWKAVPLVQPVGRQLQGRALSQDYPHHPPLRRVEPRPPQLRVRKRRARRRDLRRQDPQVHRVQQVSCWAWEDSAERKT